MSKHRHRHRPRRSRDWPPGYSYEKYIVATARGLLRETPERRAELLACLTDSDWPGWRQDVEAEIARQEASGLTAADLGPDEEIVVLQADDPPCLDDMSVDQIRTMLEQAAKSGQPIEIGIQIPMRPKPHRRHT